MGRDPPAPVYDRRDRCGKLDRRDLERLPKRDGRQLHRPDIFLLVHDGARLSRKVDPRFFHQTELAKAVIEPVYPDAQPYGDKDGITRIHGCMYKVLRPVAADLMAAYPPVPYHNITGTIERIRRLDRSRLQPGSRRDNLKRGTRLIRIVDTAVSPHGVETFLLLFLAQSFPRLPIRQFKRMIQVKLRHVCQRQDLTILWVHHKDRNAVRLLGLHRLQGKLGGVALYVDVEACVQILSVDRLDPFFSLSWHLHAFCIGHGKDCSRLSLQIFLIYHL